MATYTSSVLPTEAAYYELFNANITNGILTLDTGGYARCSLDTTRLVTMTEWFKVNVISEPFTDGYESWLTMHIHAITVDGKHYNYTCMPSLGLNSDIYSTELQLESADYDSFVVTIASTRVCRVLMWELCPEATDSNVEVLIDGVKQSLPRLLFDYNTEPVIVEQYEETIALITCNLLQNTDIQGHFNLTYTASETTTVTLRFKDNGSTELFAPLFYDVQAGRGSIGVPHAYLTRLAGYHNFTVTAQVSTGSLNIGTRGILFTVDGGYLAERVIDIGANVSDIAIEQTESDSRPSNIWIISVETGELLVRSRAYSVKTTGEAFEPRFSLGPAIDGAIEFDGYWSLAANNLSAMFRLNTYADPYCFIVDTENNLYVQRGGDEETKLLLDTGVTSVSACRGFKSTMYIEQDQGLIALYVKHEEAWYRCYAYNKIKQLYEWSAAEKVPISYPVASAYVNRLNDYRVAFTINAGTNGNYWLISSRTYVGQSFKPEILYFSPTNYVTVGLLPVGAEALSVTGTLDIDRVTITATFNFPIQCLGYEFSDTYTSYDEEYVRYFITKYINMPTVLVETLVSVKIHNNTITFIFEEPIRTAHTISFTNLYTWQYKYANKWLTFPTECAFSYEMPKLSAYNDDALTFAGQSTTSVELKPLRTLRNTYVETPISNVEPTIAVTQYAITEVDNLHTDTCTFDVKQSGSSVSLILVGQKPI